MFLEKLTPLFAKIQLVVVKLLIKLIPSPMPNSFLGPQSSLRLLEHMSYFGFKRVMLVTDEMLFKVGVTNPLTEHLTTLGVDSIVYSGVIPDPTFSVVENGLKILRDNQCDAILAVGGGSSIDAAKVIALAATNVKTPRQLVGILKSNKASMPLFVIPTTAGTGSEVTIGAVISDDVTHVKNLVIDPRVVPLAIALDADIMAGMPKTVTAATGVDALTHCLESWVSDFSDSSSEFYAGAGIKLVLQHLERACEDGQDRQAREALALAANYGGLALNKTGLGYVHAIAHQLGTQYGVPHGRANAIVLPHILEMNRQCSEVRLASLAKLCELSDDQDSNSVAADKMITRVKELLLALPIERAVEGINPKHFNEIVKEAKKEAHGTYAVPRYLSKKEILQVLHAISEEPVKKAVEHAA